MWVASSMRSALDGKRVDINLFNADPFPRLSVHVGIILSFFLEWFLPPGKNTFSAMRTAKDSSDSQQ